MVNYLTTAKTCPFFGGKWLRTVSGRDMKIAGSVDYYKVDVMGYVKILMFKCVLRIKVADLRSVTDSIR